MFSAGRCALGWPESHGSHRLGAVPIRLTSHFSCSIGDLSLAVKNVRFFLDNSGHPWAAFANTRFNLIFRARCLVAEMNVEHARAKLEVESEISSLLILPQRERACFVFAQGVLQGYT
jgi:hypothetical protein